MIARAASGLWLCTLTQHAWSDLLSSRERKFETDAMMRLSTIEARDDLAMRLNDLFDQEILEEASCRVQLETPPHYWEIFQLLAVEGLSGSEVAKRFDLKVATVFAIRSKVQTRLREAIRKLEGVEALP